MWRLNSIYDSSLSSWWVRQAWVSILVALLQGRCLKAFDVITCLPGLQAAGFGRPQNITHVVPQQVSAGAWWGVKNKDNVERLHVHICVYMCVWERDGQIETERDRDRKREETEMVGGMLFMMLHSLQRVQSVVLFALLTFGGWITLWNGGERIHY